MKVLVLGGNGFVGREVVNFLAEQKGFDVVIGSRSGKGINEIPALDIDATNRANLECYLSDFRIVINCITGDAQTIQKNASVLVEAAKNCGFPKIVHLSTQSVYGTQTGNITEYTDVKDDISWYGHAKIEAEKSMESYARNGGEVIILRPGCVAGKSSPLWTTRFVGWLKKGDLGDLAENGDGWSNIVDVTDVARAAVMSASKDFSDSLKVFNLSAPDSPRWNQYFADLSVISHSGPVRRINQRTLLIKVVLIGIPMKIMEHLLRKLGVKKKVFGEGIPPSLLKLFRQEIKLDSSSVMDELDFEFISYNDLLRKVAEDYPK